MMTLYVILNDIFSRPKNDTLYENLVLTLATRCVMLGLSPDKDRAKWADVIKKFADLNVRVQSRAMLELQQGLEQLNSQF